MKLAEAIQKTLAYHDIFDYPLKKEEILKYLIGEKANFEQLQIALQKLQSVKKVSQARGYFFLKNKKKIVSTRILRKKYSQNKLKRAFFYSTLMTLIPSIKMIAVSGALAMENSHKSDDIDLVIIASPKTLWTTRFLANILLFPFKRRPSDMYSTNNKACLNLFLDESDLKIKDQNLYTAHELAQMKVLYNHDDTYEKLIKNNAWVKKYLPNWQPYGRQFVDTKQKNSSSIFFVRKRDHHHSSIILECILRQFQLSYMRSKITNERILDTQLFFHPKDTQNQVLQKYQNRLQRRKISS